MNVTRDKAESDSMPTGGAEGSIPLELRLAVTGHRALADEWATRRAIDGALDLIAGLLPATMQADCRLVAVSALADGADRLVADSVLARPGGRLEVILPMPKAEYVMDFDPVGSLPKFEQLLGEASWVATVPSALSKDDAYVAAGKAVVDRADVTIAIWDGGRAAGKGGTGEIVGYVRQQRRPLIWLRSDGGEWVVENLERLAEISWLARLTDGDLSRLSEFNTALLHAKQRTAILTDFTQSFSNADGTGLATDLRDLLDWVRGPLVRAELLSRRFQLLYFRLSSALFALAASAVCIVGLQLVFFAHTRLVVVGEITCLIAIIGSLEWGRRRHVHERWISTRYLAERLRNAFFLALARAEEQPVAPPLGINEDPAAPWVQTAFHMVWIRRPPRWHPACADVRSLRRFLADAWIEDQRRYFEQASRRDWRKHRISTRVVEGLFLASVVVAVFHVALGGPEDWLHHLVSLLAISIPACAAALVGHSTQREYRRNAARYGWIADVLAGAREHMLAASNRARVQRVACMVDRTLRQERDDWFGTVSLHELELPA